MISELRLTASELKQCELSLCRRWQIRPSHVNADWLRTRAIKELRGVTSERRVGVIEARAVEVIR